MPHYLQFDSNTMNPSRIRRCTLEPEEFGAKTLKRRRAQKEFCRVAKIRNLQISQVAKFRNTAPVAPAAHVDYFLTHLFVVLYKFALM